MNTSATADQIIDDINRNRVALGFGFLPFEREEAAVEERRCDQIAEYWVRYKGGPVGWKGALPAIRKAFTSRDNVEMLDIVDTWEEDFHMTLADFDRLEPEIFAWVVTHAMAYGKSKF